MLVHRKQTVQQFRMQKKRPKDKNQKLHRITTFRKLPSETVRQQGDTATQMAVHVCQQISSCCQFKVTSKHHSSNRTCQQFVMTKNIIFVADNQVLRIIGEHRKQVDRIVISESIISFLTEHCCSSLRRRNEILSVAGPTTSVASSRMPSTAMTRNYRSFQRRR